MSTSACRADGPPPRSGLLVVVSGPSGSGKSTICRRLAERNGYALSVSATTRPPRPGEREGVDYLFLSREEFLRRAGEGQFLEYSEHFGNLYGTPRAPVEEGLARGKVVLLEIDVNGGRQVRDALRGLPDVRGLFLFVRPPDHEELRRRLAGRDGTGDPESVRRRLERVDLEMAMRSLYDHEIVNDDLERAVAEAEARISAQTRRHDGRCAS